MNRIANEVRSALEVEFAGDVRLVGLDGLSRDEEALGNFLIGIAEGNEGKDLLFPLGETGKPGQLNGYPVGVNLFQVSFRKHHVAIQVLVTSHHRF